MRIAKVIGTVTLNRWHPSMEGATYKLVVPLGLEELSSGKSPAAAELAAYDELGAGIGNLIAISEGREAAQPFLPEVKPVDAYNAAILDLIDVDPTLLEQ